MNRVETTLLFTKPRTPEVPISAKDLAEFLIAAGHDVSEEARVPKGSPEGGRFTKEEGDIPGVEPFKVIGRDVDGAAAKFGGHTLAELTANLSRGLPKGVTLTPYSAMGSYTGTANVIFHLDTPKGGFGELHISTTLGNYCHVDYLRVPSVVQGQGVAKQLMANLRDETQGTLDGMNLEANIDVGGYAWAKFGFVPDSWGATRGLIAVRMGSVKDDLPPESVQNIMAALKDTNPKAIWRIADDPNGYWALNGERDSGGVKVHWDGHLSYDDAEAMDRFNRYVGSRVPVAAAVEAATKPRKKPAPTSGKKTSGPVDEHGKDDWIWRELLGDDFPEDAVKAVAAASLTDEFLIAAARAIVEGVAHDVSDEARDPAGKWTKEGGEAERRIAARADEAAAKFGGHSLDEMTANLQKGITAVKLVPTSVRIAGLGSAYMTYEFHDPKNPEGARLGELMMQTSPDGTNLDLALMRINSDLQGQGIARNLMANLYNETKDTLHGMRLDANIDVGAYAWAKFGFVPPPTGGPQRFFGDEVLKLGWQGNGGIASRIEGRLNDASMSGIPAESRRIVEEAIKDPDPHAIWRVADAPGTYPLLNGDEFIGEGPMRVPGGPPIPNTFYHDSGIKWHGTLSYDDPVAMARFHRYTESAR